MLRAIQLINAAKAQSSDSTKAAAPLTVDLHPDRPAFRGFQGPQGPISLEADPSFAEIEAAGGAPSLHAETHTVCDGAFVISGEIPRGTVYELGLRRGMRFDAAASAWVEDTLIRDERLVAARVKGCGLVVFTGCSHAGVVNTARHAVEIAGGGVPLYAVVGGFHLADAELPQMQATIRDLKELGPKVLLPGHCSGWRIKYMIENESPGWLAPCTVGTKFTFSSEVGDA